ncbi:hypothetical protein TcWFU_005132 [Taenia crassiceps]|uniref:DUF5745 domain-containing protein n=1 Tax=Taenia crassiceps TaxID=6207 RepID=A0ABR4QAT1_9CEST
MNIEAIEKDIERRFDVTLSHIPPNHVIQRRPTAVEDLNEIMETIDAAKTANRCFFEDLYAGDPKNVNSPELPRRALTCNMLEFPEKPAHDKALYRCLMQESCAFISPPTTPRENPAIEIIRNPSPKSATDSGVIAVASGSAVCKSAGLEQTFDTISFLSDKIREAKTQAALLCGLCMDGSSRRQKPDLYELRNCLIKLGGDIEATVAAIDSLSPNPLDLPDPDRTTVTSIPTDSDEVEELYRLNTECERVLAEKRKLMLDSVTHCVRQFKGAINPISKHAKSVAT